MANTQEIDHKHHVGIDCRVPSGITPVPYHQCNENEINSLINNIKENATDSEVEQHKVALRNFANSCVANGNTPTPCNPDALRKRLCSYPNPIGDANELKKFAKQCLGHSANPGECVVTYSDQKKPPTPYPELPSDFRKTKYSKFKGCNGMCITKNAIQDEILNSKDVVTATRKYCIDQTRICSATVDQNKPNSDEKGQAAAFLKANLWPQTKTLVVHFMDDGGNVTRNTMATIKRAALENNEPTPIFDPLQKVMDDSPKMSAKDIVKMVIQKRYVPITGLKWSFSDVAAGSNVRVTFKGAGAWALVGTDAEKPENSDPAKATVNLGWLDIGTIIHEFGHVLGMIHEHQNPDGNIIHWDVPAVDEYYESSQGWTSKEVETNVIRRYNQNLINGSSYDPTSIMLYFFPGNLTTDNIASHQNYRLSATDVIWIAKMYPGGEKSPEDFYKEVYGESTSSQQATADKEKGKKDDSKGLPVWVIVLIAVGAVLILGTVTFFVIRAVKKSKHKEHQDSLRERGPYENDDYSY